MPIRDSEHEPESVKLKHLASGKQNVAFFDKRKVIPKLAYELGYRAKTSLYDQTYTLDVNDDNAQSICYDHDRNRVWIVCWTSPTRVLRMNPEDFTYDRLILPAGVNLGYSIAYDGKWIWVTTSDAPSAHVIRINPDTLAYTVLTLPNDGLHQYANGLCVGGGYIWVGCDCAAPPWGGWLLRFDPDLFPAYTEVDLNATIGGFTGITELVYDGQYIWAAGSNQKVARVTVTTLAVVNAGPIVGFTDFICAGCWDGSYLFWGDSAGHICRQNPLTYAYDVMTLELATGLIHGMCSDGKYIHAVDYSDGHYYIIHPETMEYVIHEIVVLLRHGICFDGLYIWITDGEGTAPGAVERFLVQEPSRRVEHGQTATVDITATGIKTIAVTFDLPFTRAPIVVVGLNDITDAGATAVIGNVEANTVTVNGFTANCKVHVAGAALSTARFMWIATERSTHHP